MPNNIEEIINNLTPKQLKTINNFKGFMEGITGTKLNNIPNKSKGLEVKEVIIEEPIEPIEFFENDNTDLTYFSEKVIKQIVKEDDENTKQMIKDYAKKRYPNENVKIDFIDEEKVNLIIELGLQEYLKRQKEQYDTKVLGIFNTEDSNIEEDIKIVEDNLFNIQKDMCLQLRISIENILNEYKRLKEQAEYDKTHILTPETIKLNYVSKDKVKEKIEELEDVLDMCKTDNNIAKYKIKQLEEEIDDFKELLEDK